MPNNLLAFDDLPLNSNIENTYIILHSHKNADDYESYWNVFSMTGEVRQRIINNLTVLRNRAAAAEESFLHLIAPDNDFKTSTSRANAFTSYINLQGFFTNESKAQSTYMQEHFGDYISTIISNEQFRDIVTQAISNAVTEDSLNDDNSDEYVTDLIATNLRKILQENTPDYLGSLAYNNKTIYDGLVSVYGKEYLNKKIQAARTMLKNKHNLQSFTLKKPRGGNVQGWIRELADSYIKERFGTLIKENNSGATIKISGENTGTKTKTQQFYHNTSTYIDNQSNPHSFRTREQPKIEVSQKADTEISIEVQLSDGFEYRYHFYISDKFRSRGVGEEEYKQLFLQSSTASINSQIRQLSDLLTNDNLLATLLFDIVNATPGAIYDRKSIDQLENTLNLLNSVYMFDNIQSSLMNEYTSAIMLFSINAGVIPISCVFDALLNAASKQDLFIKTDIQYGTNAQVEYDNMMRQIPNIGNDSPDNRATYLRSRIFRNTSLQTSFNGSLMASVLNLNRFLTRSI